MHVSGADQHEIQLLLANLSPEDRRKGMTDARHVLSNLSILAQRGLMSADEERSAGYLIEYLCRAECAESGRGPFYRMKRRLALVHEYFKP